jgi:clan AA aspartic protease
LVEPEEASGSIGEVRTAVTLTNATESDLVRRGKLTAEGVHSYKADALVDTGSVRTVLPVQVVQQLDLAIRGRRVVELADGRKETVSVTGPVEIDINGRSTIEDALVLGDEVIIGQTVLEVLDLFVDCTNRRLVPNPAHPDQPVVKIK